MATIRLIPSSYELSSTQYLTISNTSNMYANTDSTTYATITNTQNGTTSYYIYIRGFNFNDIPSDATVNSFTIKLKANESGVSTSDNYKPYLSNGTTAINGSCSAIETSVQTYTFTGLSADWSTISGYGNNFGIRINCRRANRNTTGYLYVYGAEIEVNYTLPVYHQITSVSNTDLVDSISPEGVTSVLEGNNYSLDIYTSDISNIIVEDNNSDVTNQLVQHEVQSSGSETTVLGTYTLVSGSFNGSGGTYFQGLVGKGVNSTQTTSNYYSGGSGTIAVFTYNLSFSNIPSNATITRLYCQVNGHAESTSNSNEYMCVQLRSGSTELCTEYNFKSAGTSNSTQTIEATTLPTLAQLSNLTLYCRLGYYGGAINGATCYVEYTTPSTGQYYWTYTLSNIVTDHTISVSENIIVPPDEDPTKTYYPITISSINATTTPSRGTTRFESGTNETITIYPSDPLITLITDNGVDVSSQLVQHGSTIPTPTVTTASGASYGFTLNSSTGYYVSQNTGVDKSAAVCVINFNLPVRCLVTINYINYAEATYDFGIFGNIDVPLTNTYKSASGSMPDSNYKLACNTSTYNTSSVQTITYEIPSGQHVVYIKYTKDDATSSNNDSLQWKIANIEPLEATNYYTYTLSNINQEHSLIFIFGNVTYYFVNSAANGDCMLYPNGSMVQLPGDEYRLTIVPNESDDIITITDNNTDVTSQLEKKEIQIEKEGVTTTVVNYIYRLSNIQATHNINVVCSQQGLDSYIHYNNQWSQGELLRKQNDRWNTLTYTKIWVHNGTSWVENVQRTITTKGFVFGGLISD